MRFKETLILSGAVLMAVTVALSGCQSRKKSKADYGDEKVYKVGIVQYIDNASSNQIESNIEAELDAKSDELHVIFDYAGYTFNGQADTSTLKQIASELIEDKVDVIIPIATPVAQIMQAETVDHKIPVIFSAVSDPVGAGLVDSMEAPGANVTGVCDALDTEAVMGLMLAANPGIKKAGILYDSSQDASVSSVGQARAFLSAKGIEVVEQSGSSEDKIEEAAQTLIDEQVEAIFTPTDNTVMTSELEIYQKFIDAGIPHYAGADAFALNGAFCGYGVNYREVGKETADMAVEVLVNGTDPASMPVKTIEGGIATVNVETADALGIDYSCFADLCSEVVETVTRQEFDD